VKTATWYRVRKKDKRVFLGNGKKSVKECKKAKDSVGMGETKRKAKTEGESKL